MRVIRQVMFFLVQALILRNRPANHDDKTFPAHPELVTFVDRPFPLEDAPEHFARLRRWGLTFSMLKLERLVSLV